LAEPTTLGNWRDRDIDMPPSRHFQTATLLPIGALVERASGT